MGWDEASCCLHSLLTSLHATHPPCLLLLPEGVATSNLTWGNSGTVNLTHVTLGTSSNVADPRVAAIIVACAGFTQNGTLPAGSSLLQCTETLNFQNVTYIEGGDVVFNITATADNGVVRSQQVTIPVSNAPALTLKLNTSKCSAPTNPNKAGVCECVCPMKWSQLVLHRPGVMWCG